MIHDDATAKAHRVLANAAEQEAARVFDTSTRDAADVARAYLALAPVPPKVLAAAEATIKRWGHIPPAHSNELCQCAPCVVVRMARWIQDGRRAAGG